jgi:hypothetical protein
MAKQKILSTKNLNREKATVVPGVKKRRIITTADGDKTDIQFIAENLDALKDGDILKLKAKIEKVIAARKPTWWRCNKCGMVRKRAWNAERNMCICNTRGYADGGFLEPMSDAEVEKHLEETREKARAESERRFQAALERVNRSRREAGRPEFSADDLRKQRERFNRKMFPMSPFNT